MEVTSKIVEKTSTSYKDNEKWFLDQPRMMEDRNSKEIVLIQEVKVPVPHFRGLVLSSNSSLKSPPDFLWYMPAINSDERSRSLAWILSNYKPFFGSIILESTP